MPRDIPVGNGQLLVTFDRHYQIRDIYFPHVGQENHAGGGPCRFGVWAEVPQTRDTRNDRRKQRLFWSDDGWDLKLVYQADTLATDVSMRHDALGLNLRCCDVVDFHRPVLVRRVEVTNLTDQHRQVRLFAHNDFNMYGTKVGDTAFFDPKLCWLIHYRRTRYLMTGWYRDGDQVMDQYATGTAGFRGAEGTWRDAEDGSLSNNPIAQGAVDSTMMVRVDLAPRGTQTVHMVLGAGHDRQELENMHAFLSREGPAGVIDRTNAYWRMWLSAARGPVVALEHGSPPRSPSSPRGLTNSRSPTSVVELFKRSLLLVRCQIDNSGAVIAANDSDIMQFSRDTYSYMWPRDGAMVADAVDAAGFPDLARRFFGLCAQLITKQGYFLHKYNPDSSAASSWHPWVRDNEPHLPIQEDETALVLWALWRHYERHRDIEFVRPLWLELITPAADFLAHYCDPATGLPLPSYDLWEERWGIHTFTVATVYGGLRAAHQFASSFGDQRRASLYGNAAARMRRAFCAHFWSVRHDRFVRRLEPLDRARTARLIAPFVEPHAADDRGVHDAEDSLPAVFMQTDGADEAHAEDAMFEIDTALDSSAYAIFAMGLLGANDPRVERTMRAIERGLWVATPVGGMARYEGDQFHRCNDGPAGLPGNPWFICTLWLAEWRIARARTVKELREALPIFEWVADHALQSGVLAEQVHPVTNEPLSVSPLTWSHATVVSTLVAYWRKLEQMNACPNCGQPKKEAVTEPVPAA